MVCAKKPVRANYFVSPRDWEVEEEEEAPNGGLFSWDEVPPGFPRLVEPSDWVLGRGWFYLLTLFQQFSPDMNWNMFVVA